jgi:hypothetical protein
MRKNLIPLYWRQWEEGPYRERDLTLSNSHVPQNDERVVRLGIIGVLGKHGYFPFGLLTWCRRVSILHYNPENWDREPKP